ncbi:pro-pol polyprotein [Lasius niger]|uniref:Pro-pol polyprotein n=1 Tax=Lasius niger TaxID=67767 RepID=A0A0J7JYK7_LASNI|nr:pro-pol polyprotein [Lasius niger]
MAHVDCLSRSIMTISLITIEDKIMYKQLADPKIKELAEDLETRDHKYFVLIEGLVFRKYQDKYLFVIPENMVYSVIRIYHDDMEHVGIDKTVYGILGHYWFPCLKLRVKQYIENCVKCLSYSLVRGKPEGEMEIFEKIAIPFHTLHIDYFGPLETTKDHYK